ncbi:GNAT family N-acetyltransferase [Enterovibrio sp. ZSDZ35]|uniref:GNAT family N-acetyltransferase n=1 Tax=Enterovibrio qingdaonensis TaxID=2899818 RepID=A0ABT5QIH7_9GAMM|nr:GNAT family N-acetyltransferase [Enterovibrio sp. ZSDZ35]MDD1780121.1 GNAT family N-acetyltransferase [Enterovibrio sp. ZSDZ35]
MDRQTERLILRPFIEEDREPFAQLNADPDVMRHFPAPLSHAESDDVLLRIARKWQEYGISYWAIRLKSTGEFVGTIGINFTDYLVVGEYVYEIGWRICPTHQRKGYAKEAAQEALRIAFDEMNLEKVMSFTILDNIPSQRVMQSLGMTNTGNQFAHPLIEADHRCSIHCLYALTKEEWQRMASAS